MTIATRNPISIRENHYTVQYHNSPLCRETSIEKDYRPFLIAKMNDLEYF